MYIEVYNYNLTCMNEVCFNMTFTLTYLNNKYKKYTRKFHDFNGNIRWCH